MRCAAGTSIASDLAQLAFPGGLPEVSPHPSTKELAEIVASLGTTGALATVLREVLGDPVRLDVLARQSSRHPLGFAKLPLGVLTDPRSHGPVLPRIRLRMHVWSADHGSTRPPDEPHAHRWHFASIAVSGGDLHVVHFEESETGEMYHLFEYGTSESTLTERGPRRLSAKHVFTRRRGEVYECDLDTVHTIDPVDPRESITTLIAQGQRADLSTFVYRREADDRIADQPALTPSELRVLLLGAIGTG